MAMEFDFNTGTDIITRNGQLAIWLEEFEDITDLIMGLDQM